MQETKAEEQQPENDLGKLIGEKITTIKLMFPKGVGIIEALIAEIAALQVKYDALVLTLEDNKMSIDGYEANMTKAITQQIENEHNTRKMITMARPPSRIIRP